jgi:hypothetical protein
VESAVEKKPLKGCIIRLLFKGVIAMMKKTKTEKKISKVYNEFKAGKLHSGKGGPIVKSKAQGLAIALSAAGVKPKKAMK